jgi:hypothetical protein
MCAECSNGVIEIIAFYALKITWSRAPVSAQCIFLYLSKHQNTLMYIGILQPSGLGVTVEVRNGSDDLNAFAGTLVSDLREHFPPDIQRAPPARRAVMIANYERMVDGELGGHWSPLGGVWWHPSAAEPDRDKTYVLIASGDVGPRALPPHWITLREFVLRCSSLVSKHNSAYRGYVVLEAPAAVEGGGGDGSAAAAAADVAVDDATAASASLTIS